MLQRWLTEPGVVRWWEGDDVSWYAVNRDYGPACVDRVEHHLALIGGRPLGWIQCYVTADHPEEDEVQAWWAMGLPTTTAGIDYLIGEADDRGRGLGSRMIRAFVEDVVFPDHPAWTHVAASPQEGNAASWGALARAGFAYWGSFGHPRKPCRIMARARPPR